MKKLRLLFFVLALGCGLCLGQLVWAGDHAQHAVIISFDGLRPDAITQLGPANAPHFYDLMREGAFTLNARTDPDWTVTMPNHTCMLTGRGVNSPQGHQYTGNQSADRSIHENKGSYVASIFDVAKDHGLSTGFFASKLKFQAFINSYGGNKAKGRQAVDLRKNNVIPAPVLERLEDGPGKAGIHRNTIWMPASAGMTASGITDAYINKIDVHFLTDQDDELTLDHALAQIKENLPALTFIHFAGPDKAGHHHGWSLEKNSAYLSAVKSQDLYLGKILDAIRQDPALAQSTIIFITSDHGGRGMNHSDIKDMHDYRIPLIIWGKGVAVGMDLYTINVGIRENPKGRQVPYDHGPQPIRNGDAANAALHALGLPLVPGSTIGNPDPVRVATAKNDH